MHSFLIVLVFFPLHRKYFPETFRFKCKHIIEKIGVKLALPFKKKLEQSTERPHLLAISLTTPSLDEDSLVSLGAKGHVWIHFVESKICCYVHTGHFPRGAWPKSVLT